MKQAEKAEKKENKQSALLLVLLILLATALVAILCFGGFTLAKYITTGSGSGSANVAKWGFTIDVDADNIFGSNYKYDTDKNASVVETASAADLTVKAESTDRKLVAPGATGSMSFKVGGTAEVSAMLKMSMNNVKDVKLSLTKDGTTYDYCPVKWTLVRNNGNTDETLVSEGSLDDVATKLTKGALIEAGVDSTEHGPAGTYTLSWEWAFENTALPAGLTEFTADELDTLLGQASNGTDVSAAKGYTVTAATEIAFDLSISVAQVNQ